MDKHPDQSNSHYVGDVLYDFLLGTPAFTFFVSIGGEIHYQSELGSVVDLLRCYVSREPYNGPYSESAFDLHAALARRRSIVAEAEGRILEFKRRAEKFVVLWQACGEQQVHLDYSADYPSRVDALKDIVSYLENSLHMLPAGMVTFSGIGPAEENVETVDMDW